MKFLSVVFGLATLLTLTACQSDPSAYTPTPSTSTPPTVAQNEEADTRTGELAVTETESMETFGATYTAYEAEAATGEKHVLFFHADWCPTCVKWEKNVIENMTQLNDNVVIYKTDYDTSDDLKSQYEITQQSMAVFVNADGSVAKKEADPSIESLNAFFAN